MRLLRLVVVCSAVAAFLALSERAPAQDQPPPLGTTITTICTFNLEGSPGITSCNREIITTLDRGCIEGGYRLYETVVSASARSYRGYAVRPGVTLGVWIEGDYSDLVQPHAKLIDDTGEHPFSFGTTVPDESCI